MITKLDKYPDLGDRAAWAHIYTKYLPIQAHKVFTREKSVNQANFPNVQCELKVVSAHLSFLVNPKVPIEQSSQSF